MSWYSIFYWISVADNVKSFFDVASNIFTTIGILSFIALVITKIIKACNYDDYTSEQKVRESCDSFAKWATRASIPFIILAVIMWMGYAFCPSKKDSLIIVTGGAVGQFISSDSSARTIPAEAMTLLRDRIKQEIREINSTSVTKKLEDMTKEELLEQIKKDKSE